MIEMPRRSVTRFFIPLIDVMILLFCVFLLMPIFEEARREEEEDDPASASGFHQRAENLRLARNLKTAQGEIARLKRNQTPLRTEEREELERLRREKSKPLQKLYAIFVLNIDGKTGNLFYYEPAAPDRKVVIDSALEAAALVERQRKEAGARQLFFLLRVPRVRTPHPTGKDVEDKYDKWFSKVRYEFDSPPAAE